MHPSRNPKKYPTISVVMPTLNAAKNLDQSLASIKKQDYPKNLVEIIIPDGGSCDQTLKIARKYKAKILLNKLKTTEGGTSIGIRAARGELVLLMDSDNILPETKWLLKMTKPFRDDSEITGAEPLYYQSRKSDSYINRYCALIGANDPVCMFLGNHDRYNYLTRQWTGIDLKQEKKEGFIKLQATNKLFPTIGANGFLARKKDIRKYADQDYFFDIDVSYNMAVNEGKTFAKVNVGIYHLYASELKTFCKKQKRRVLDFLYFKGGKHKRIYPWDHQQNIYKIIKFSLYSFFILPAFLQSLLGYSRKQDRAWFFHPLACWLTLVIYGYYTVRAKILNERRIMSRENW